METAANQSKKIENQKENNSVEKMFSEVLKNEQKTSIVLDVNFDGIRIRRSEINDNVN